jgi:hypothetical protein
VSIPGEPTVEEQKALGIAFPSEWVAPVLRVRMKPEPTVTEFCGTATLLGGLFLLTARHVIESSLAARGLSDGEFFCVSLFQVEGGGRQYIRRILVHEHHADAGVDLTIARFADFTSSRLGPASASVA